MRLLLTGRQVEITPTLRRLVDARLAKLQRHFSDALVSVQVVLSREKKWAKPGAGKVITTFVFRVRNVPAALYKALGGFATNGVNMTKLESYMVEGQFFATQFYAEVDGHPDDLPLKRALDELTFFSREFRVLGVYPAHPFRESVNEPEA